MKGKPYCLKYILYECDHIYSTLISRTKITDPIYSVMGHERSSLNSFSLRYLQTLAWMFSFFIPRSSIQTKIKEMDHSNIFYLEMELVLFLLLTKKQVIFMPQEELIGKKRPFILYVHKLLTEEL